MRAGLLRHTINIDKLVETQDAYGAPAVSWQSVATNVPASVDPITGSEVYANQAIENKIEYKVGIRYMAGLTARMRITTVVGGVTRLFDIEKIFNWQGRDRELTLLCKEGTDRG